MDEEKKLSRINGLLPTNLYLQLKIKLLKQSKSFNKWLKEKAEEEVAKE